MLIERYSHVMHIVSNVEGKLKPRSCPRSTCCAPAFPAGTVSGAPKVRAMEIIDELEPSKRGIYAGAVGYLGFNGDMDLAIAIRTAVVKDGMLYVAGRRRHRRRLGARQRMDGNAQQGARRRARSRTGTGAIRQRG